MDFKTNIAAFLVEDFEKNKMSESERTRPSQSAVKSGERRDSKKDAFLQDYTHRLEVEVVLLEDLIKPLMCFIEYFLPFHDVIKYDPIAKCCVFIRGSLLRKVFCILWELLIIYRLGIRAIPSLSSDNGSSESIVSKAAYFIFILFSLVGFYACWTKAQAICDIFNRVLNLSKNLHLNCRSPPRIKVVKHGAYGCWIFVTFYLIYSIIIYLINTFANSTNLPIERLTLSPSAATQNASTGRAVNRFDMSEIHHATDYNIVMQIVAAVGSFTNILTWMTQFMHVGIWGLFFRQLILLFYWRIEAVREEGQFIVFPEEIRTFNKIVSIIDDYNKMHGLMNLLGAVVIVTYISLSAKQAFVNLSDVLQMGSGLHLLLSYIPMAATAIMASEVQRVAGSFAGILKDEYGRFTKECCGDPAETLCGISIVHYDLATSSIGIKGTGFYTASYQFITTIVSVIITYSILVVQLFPHDNDTVGPG